MGIDLSRFKVIYDNKVLNAIALMNIEMPERTCREIIEKPKKIDVLVFNEDGNIVSIQDEAWRFQFLPIIQN